MGPGLGEVPGVRQLGFSPQSGGVAQIKGLGMSGVNMDGRRLEVCPLHCDGHMNSYCIGPIGIPRDLKSSLKSLNLWNLDTTV